MTPFDVVCDLPLPSSARERIASATAEARIDFRPPPSPNDHVRPDPGWRRDLGDARVLITHWPPLDWNLAPELEWIQLDSAGVDYLVDDPVWSRGLTITNGAGAYAVQLAQWALGYLIAVMEDHQGRARAQENHYWPNRGDEHDRLVGRLLRGQTMVVVGYGGIGREVARLAHAFGVRVIAVKAHPEVRVDDAFRLTGTGDPDVSIPERIVGIDELTDVAHGADSLVITAPLTVSTRHLVNTSVLAALPATAWVVNVGRGAVIDETALIDALRSKRIAGAILDVFEVEPLPRESPLWDLPNVIITPHAAGGAAVSMELFAQLAAENLQRFARGQPLRNVVDPDARY